MISKEDLPVKANLEFPTLAGPASKLDFTRFDAPKTVATQCSALKRGRDFIIAASGRVEINS